MANLSASDHVLIDWSVDGLLGTGDYEYHSKSMLKFDLSGQGETITSARLYIYMLDVEDWYYNSLPISLHTFTTDWSYDGNTASQIDGINIGSAIATYEYGLEDYQTGGWQQFDVTSYAASARAASLPFTVVLYRTPVTSGRQVLKYKGSELANGLYHGLPPNRNRVLWSSPTNPTTSTRPYLSVTSVAAPSGSFAFFAGRIA
jgi:hypothetical protein